MVPSFAKTRSASGKLKAMNTATVARLTLSFALFVSLAVGQGGDKVQASVDATHPENANAVYQVTGRVVDDVTGSPLSGVAVRLQIVFMHISCKNCEPPPHEPPPPQKVVTGKDGFFAFDNIPAKSVSITSEKAGYMNAWQIRRHASDQMGIYPAGEHMGPIVLRLARVASISGVFRDHNGALVRKNTIVSLWRLSAWDGWPRVDYGAFATFDAEGKYHFDNLAPGRYYLVAEPPVNHDGPTHDEAGRAVGETPMRYPAASEAAPNPFFTLREGEQARIDFRFPLKTLHRVTGTIEEDQNYSYSIEDADRANTYLITGSPFERKLEAWLPKGTFWLSTGRDDVSGTMPFEVADSDVGNLQFSIDSRRVEIPIEVSTARGDPAGEKLEPPRGLSFLRMVRILPGGYVGDVQDSIQNEEDSPPLRAASVSVGPADYTVSLRCGGIFMLNPLSVERRTLRLNR